MAPTFEQELIAIRQSRIDALHALNPDALRRLPWTETTTLSVQGKEVGLTVYRQELAEMMSSLLCSFTDTSCSGWAGFLPMGSFSVRITVWLTRNANFCITTSKWSGIQCFYFVAINRGATR